MPRPWRINLHVPWWARGSGRPGDVRLPMLNALQTAMLDRSDVGLSVSAKAHPPLDFAGDRVWTLNFHSLISRARNLNYKEAYLPHYFTFDHAGYSGWSANARMIFDLDAYGAAESAAYFDTALHGRYLSRGRSKYDQPTQRQQIPTGGVFVALQVPGDAVLQLAHLSTEAMLGECLRRAPAEPVLIKLHPRTHDPGFEAKVRALHDPGANIHVLDEPIDALIAAARVTVCVNSGVGIEAQLRGAAVITCGQSDYGTLTDIATTPSELAAALQSAEPPDPDLMRRHATWLFRDVFVDIEAIDWTGKVLRRLRRA